MLQLSSLEVPRMQPTWPAASELPLQHTVPVVALSLLTPAELRRCGPAVPLVVPKDIARLLLHLRLLHEAQTLAEIAPPYSHAGAGGFLGHVGMRQGPTCPRTQNTGRDDRRNPCLRRN